MNQAWESQAPHLFADVKTIFTRRQIMHGALIDVSKVFLDKLTLTKHAEEQVARRGISLPTIKAVVDRGASQVSGGAVKFNLLGFVVILDGYKVVTVYEQ